MKGGSTHSNAHQIDTLTMRNLPRTEEELSNQTAGLRQVCHHFPAANLLLPRQSLFMRRYSPASRAGDRLLCSCEALAWFQRTGANSRDPSKTTPIFGWGAGTTRHTDKCTVCIHTSEHWLSSAPQLHSCPPGLWVLSSAWPWETEAREDSSPWNIVKDENQNAKRSRPSHVL